MSSKPDMFRVTTLSGSVYEIDVDGSFFRKLGPYAQDGWQRLWTFQSAPADGLKPHLDRESGGTWLSLLSGSTCSWRVSICGGPPRR